MHIPIPLKEDNLSTKDKTVDPKVSFVQRLHCSESDPFIIFKRCQKSDCDMNNAHFFLREIKCLAKAMEKTARWLELASGLALTTTYTCTHAHAHAHAHTHTHTNTHARTHARTHTHMHTHVHTHAHMHTHAHTRTHTHTHAHTHTPIEVAIDAGCVCSPGDDVATRHGQDSGTDEKVKGES